jgi:iron complex transport system substrate-binding protein
MIKKEPGFHVLKAVRENRIFLIDEKLVSRPTMGLLEGIKTVHNILYSQAGQETQ